MQGWGYAEGNSWRATECTLLVGGKGGLKERRDRVGAGRGGGEEGPTR